MNKVRSALATSLAMSCVSLSSLAATPAQELVHVKVEVQSEFFGSFVQERSVPVNDAAAFSNVSVHRPRVVNRGTCNVGDVPNMSRTIDDGVTVEVTPQSATPDGTYFVSERIEASKFVRYRTVDQGKCGRVDFAESTHALTAPGTGYLAKPGLSQQIVLDADGAAEHRLIVTVTVSPSTE